MMAEPFSLLDNQFSIVMPESICGSIQIVR